MKIKKKTQKYLQIGAIALGAVMLFGITSAILDDGERTLSPLTGYQVAAVETDGDLDKDAKTNIVSNFVPLDKLKVTNENEDISFVLHYYDDDKEFISSSAESMKEYDAAAEGVTVPAGAEYARIEFTHAEDDKISLTELWEYLKDVEVSYEK